MLSRRLVTFDSRLPKLTPGNTLLELTTRPNLVLPVFNLETHSSNRGQHLKTGKSDHLYINDVAQ